MRGRWPILKKSRRNGSANANGLPKTGKNITENAGKMKHIRNGGGNTKRDLKLGKSAVDTKKNIVRGLKSGNARTHWIGNVCGRKGRLSSYCHWKNSNESAKNSEHLLRESARGNAIESVQDETGRIPSNWNGCANVTGAMSKVKKGWRHGQRR